MNPYISIKFRFSTLLVLERIWLEWAQLGTLNAPLVWKHFQLLFSLCLLPMTLFWYDSSHLLLWEMSIRALLRNSKIGVPSMTWCSTFDHIWAIALYTFSTSAWSYTHSSPRHTLSITTFESPWKLENHLSNPHTMWKCFTMVWHVNIDLPLW